MRIAEGSQLKRLLELSVEILRSANNALLRITIRAWGQFHTKFRAVRNDGRTKEASSVSFAQNLLVRRHGQKLHKLR